MHVSAEKKMPAPQDITVLLILVVLAVLYIQLGEQQSPPRRRSQGPSPTTPAATGMSGLLARVKWSTITRMLHWKAEMSKLDAILDTVTAPPTDSAPTVPP